MNITAQTPVFRGSIRTPNTSIEKIVDPVSDLTAIFHSAMVIQKIGGPVKIDRIDCERQDNSLLSERVKGFKATIAGLIVLETRENRLGETVKAMIGFCTGGKPIYEIYAESLNHKSALDILKQIILNRLITQDQQTFKNVDLSEVVFPQNPTGNEFVKALSDVADCFEKQCK